MYMFDFHRQIVSYYDFFMSGWLNPNALFIKPNDIVSFVGRGGGEKGREDIIYMV